MRILLAGAAGMLGRDVQRAAARADVEVVAMDSHELDVRDPRSVAAALEGAGAGSAGAEGAGAKGTGGGSAMAEGAGAGGAGAGSTGVDAVLNCAAWTDVDGAEDHPAEAHAVNADGAGNLARAAAALGIPLVHVSTDYVFDGSAPLDAGGRPRAYVESDPTGPRSVYGQSKLAGEQQVLAASPRHLVVRTAWLFGLDGRNFVDTMLRLAGEREAVQVVHDQTGCPTWTGHLAPALLGMLQRELHGLVHLAGGGAVTWNAFAREIFRQAERPCRVQDATTAQMARPAPRPAWSVLASQRDDVLPMPDWREGLAGYLAARAGMMRA